MPITIRLERFEGPLDLLLYLIQSHELDISKISIGRITEQYVAYVRLMQELNFDVASDFLVMAATLIQWKSKALLPVEETAAGAQASEDDVLTPEELMRQLMEHQRFLEMGRELAARPLLGDDVFSRPITRPPTEKVWKNMEVTQLALTFQDLLVRERKRTQLLKKETVSLSTKIMDFADRLAVGKITGMNSLLRDLASRPERVVTFLASLELARLRKMKVYQEGTYEEIYVELLESLKGFDTRLASGFDSLTEQVDKQIEAGTTTASADFVPGPDHVAGHAPAEFHSVADHSGAGADSAAAAESGSDSGREARESAEAGASSFVAGDRETGAPGEAALGGTAPSMDLDRAGDAAESGTQAASGGRRSRRRADRDDVAAAAAPGAEASAEGRRTDDDGMDVGMADASTAEPAAGDAGAFDLHSFGEDSGAPLSGPDSAGGEPAPALAGGDTAAGRGEHERNELDPGRSHGRHE